MEFRKLTKEDIPSLLELYVQLDGPNDGFSVEDANCVWEKISSNPAITYFGAVDGGKVVSTCYLVIIPNLTRHGSSIGFIENVVTDSKYRRQGLARHVMQMAIEEAKRCGCYKAILQSGISRKEAHRMYENLGFNGASKRAYDLRF